MHRTDRPDPAAVPRGGSGRHRRGRGRRGHAALRAAEDDKALVAITLDLEMSRNFPDPGRHALGLREGQPQRRDEGVHRRGLPPRQGGGRGAPLLRGRPGLRAGERRLAQGDRGGGPPGRQPHLRPRQRAGDAAGGRAVPLPAGALADRGPDPGRGDPRQHPPGHRGHEGAAGHASRPASALPAASRDGLRARPDVRAMLREQGFGWVSSLYPPHKTPRPVGGARGRRLRQHRPGPGRRPSRSSIPTGWSRSR